MGSSQSKPKRHTEDSPPFLNWDGSNPVSFPASKRLYESLITMMEEDYAFDDGQQLKAVKLLDFVRDPPTAFQYHFISHLFPHEADKDTAFLNHMWIMLRCPSWIVLKAAFSFFKLWFVPTRIDVRFSFINDVESAI
ncbi:hypothetical protein BLNAU_14761 [Blattamonas nauphoetae]|uniref:Uncharacterized protein n=1 Tax=Blattamonas nauphoetae TaxID=2049346 RepID=A0ABQ9XF00_9EUKA|nr:hypothetical protein BLNAU_14761 [Blattamonas nauphoetae]